VHSLAEFQEYLMHQQLEDVYPETYNFTGLSLTTPATPVTPQWSLFSQYPTPSPFHHAVTAGHRNSSFGFVFIFDDVIDVFAMPARKI